MKRPPVEIGKLDVRTDLSQGIDVDANCTVLRIDDVKIGNANAKAKLGLKEGLGVGANAGLLEDKNIKIVKAGVNGSVGKDGVDVGVEGTLARAELKSDNFDVGFGLNVNTGLKNDYHNSMDLWYVPASYLFVHFPSIA
ncbi:unnamed protein product [Caenorhabditis bovis]|uniref:Uncharacterized protein n=1 Tax=Caenorhabditis bovis TaxID=2654633 RepID=A0A8S1EU67_9PELO|nr:unnamed protein product [Caenorhabditis bovis]